MGVDPMMKLPEPPPERVPPLPKGYKWEPMLYDVDTPGEWHDFTYVDKMEKQQYKQYCLPTGTVPFAPNEHGEWQVNGWKLTYKGWLDDKGEWSNMIQEIFSPPGRKGFLDKKLFKKYGLTNQCMQSCDDLFFHQLILPICVPERSDITNDEGEGYCVEVIGWIVLYAVKVK
jgi:hypothetical protein